MNRCKYPNFIISRFIVLGLIKVIKAKDRYAILLKTKNAIMQFMFKRSETLRTSCLCESYNCQSKKEQCSKWVQSSVICSCNRGTHIFLWNYCLIDFIHTVRGCGFKLYRNSIDLPFLGIVVLMHWKQNESLTTE